MARTDTLGNFLTDVANAIREKKGTTDTIQASNFDTEIASIEGGGKYAPRYILFRNYTGQDLTEEINNLDTSNITNMKEMFYNCSSLSNLDLTGFDTNNVTTMASMFYNCSKLTSLDLSNFNTNNVIGISAMFQQCSSLETINLNNFNPTSISTMASMFYNCSKLTSLDLSSFYAINITNLNSTFDGCSVLNKLDIRNFDFTNVTSSINTFRKIPVDCEIIVKDDTAKEWVLTQRSDFTNVKTVAELGA